MTALAGSATPAQGQPHADTRTRPGAYFAGGSVLTWWNAGAEQDPEGAGYLLPYFHGALDWPALGAKLDGGVFITHSWAVGAEVALRRPQSAIISEDGRAKFESWHLSPRYRDRERLMSVVARRNMSVGGSVDVQAVGGLTVSRTTQSLTDRRGTYVWYGGTVPIERPDQSVDATRYGLVGGADIVFGRRRDVSVACAARVHWINRPEYDPLDRVAPAQGPFIVYFGAGITWLPHRR